MGRQSRVLLDNGIYHVMTRGNRKQDVFLEKLDYLKYLEILSHYKNKHRFKLYAYCLMPNHIHLVLQVESGITLSLSMRDLNRSYANWFNEKYNKVGHLWQDRYRCKLIEKDRYMLECLEYVEFNPIRANLCKTLIEYPFTSWQERYGHKKNKLIDSLG